MNQVKPYIPLLLAVALMACSAGKPGATNGIARIRATAIAAQQDDAPTEATAPTAAPIEQAQPQPQPATVQASATAGGDQTLDFIAALGIILSTFALGCFVGSVITANYLSKKGARHV
jgi:hypothetical protein